MAGKEQGGLSALTPQIDVGKYLTELKSQSTTSFVLRGRVRRITGMLIRARLPNAKLGEICSIEPPGRPPVLAQIVGFDDEDNNGEE